MEKHKLMIKTHLVTGLKYLCYTKSDGDKYKNYKGSGILWKKHLKKYGDNISTELIFETDNKEEFRLVALEKSIEFDVIKSKDWANLKNEEGDGGDTVSMKMWITDGFTDKYINKDDNIPDGWKKGRSKCIFNDKKMQGEFSSRVDQSKKSISMKKAWDSGIFEKRDHKKCGCKGENNVACRPDVKEKIAKAALSRSDELSEQMKRIYKSMEMLECPYCKKSFKPGNAKRWHFDKCKYKSDV